MLSEAALLREARAGDAPACAGLIDAWITATDWMPRVHGPDALLRHFREHVMRTCHVLVAEREGAVEGFLSVDGEGLVAGLFVAGPAQGRGVGSALLGAAKALRPEGLTLWTFAANAAARRFYARRGFVEVGGTAGENDEGLPDLMLAWRAGA